ncbi:hypothetical protein BCR41DRAFT_360206 [Lobosporangium transversale]|uniref:Uncharacterized protein n=1 Tax=Lobosporangium transversale TaxID=64571 RepID=A0A1Y2GF13_9FUNG|nr:hypothetical protein BCR41DRAFT_360206 [Lobosporangium transversale]ORZ07218.1 hypothetical protein BCR41DRAFT_360206 [Lobosporangium transversale]|eukprot:XP_021877881.1 hypothetical protein BCR41DRAFT_360206 [Lobosporangium transversale]
MTVAIAVTIVPCSTAMRTFSLLGCSSISAVSSNVFPSIILTSTLMVSSSSKCFLWSSSSSSSSIVDASAFPPSVCPLCSISSSSESSTKMPE